MPLPPNERSNQEQRLTELRAALGEDAFQAAFAAGRNRAWEQAVADALEARS